MLFDLPEEESSKPLTSAYRVLARQYRPRKFEDVIGQETAIRVITQAFTQNRLGHGFLFSGIRGIGKTTTARLLAGLLNCLNPQKSPLSEAHGEPCGTCVSCVGFREEKHLDIIEMDAASHTGVDDIREILDACRYRPTMGQYKIFIIDEVHMLSKSAFNALLKTLEEPPEHVKFIFATTEVRKIPPTILSRCLRFELRRIEPDVLVPYLRKVCTLEKIEAEEAALFLIAKAGAGSVRDSLSLLDQAIVLAMRDQKENLGTWCIQAQDVREMLGTLDREKIGDLFDALVLGDAAASVEYAHTLYLQGIEPLMMLEEISEILHQLSCLKSGAKNVLRGLSEQEKAFLEERHARVTLPLIGRLWQMVLKGVQEVRQAAFPQSALEMVLVRLAYVAPLPTPDQLLPNLREEKEAVKSHAPSVSSAPTPLNSVSISIPPASAPLVKEKTPLKNFQQVMEVLQEKREGLLYTHLKQDVVLEHFEEGRILLNVRANAPQDLCKKLEHFLVAETGRNWQVRQTAGKSAAPGKTLLEIQQEEKKQKLEKASQNPLVAEAQALFPGSTLKDVLDNVS